jgi:hypothetical protein
VSVGAGVYEYLRADVDDDIAENDDILEVALLAEEHDIWDESVFGQAFLLSEQLAGIGDARYFQTYMKNPWEASCLSIQCLAASISATDYKHS